MRMLGIEDMDDGIDDGLFQDHRKMPDVTVDYIDWFVVDNDFLFPRRNQVLGRAEQEK